ncbi:MAG: MBL fold metallo-hydrolase [Proteobacteria bacterium]|nr:MBL fold metallo-hydrolase [Pseudomonadota bacterium]
MGDGVYAWLQPDGTWGWNNAGLVAGGGESLLVDTLFDLALTREMLAGLAAAEPAAKNITTLVNTHGNGDHWFGNSLVPGARILATETCAAEMAETPPQMLAELMTAAPALGEMGEYLVHAFGAFTFSGIEPVYPTEIFTGETEVSVGGRIVQLLDLGPAHTKSDLAVWVPDQGVLFSSDLLFIQGTPILWSGPVENWVAACDRMLDLKPKVVVPGHGPVTDEDGIREFKDYMERLAARTAGLFRQGVPADEAAIRLMGEMHHGLTDPERTVINVDSLYRRLSGDEAPANIVDLFTRMARVKKVTG